MPKLETTLLYRVAGSLNLAFGLLLSGVLCISIYGTWASPIPLVVAGLGFVEARYAPALSVRWPVATAVFSVLCALVAAPVVYILLMAALATLGEGEWLLPLGLVVLIATITWLGAQGLKFLLWLGGLIESRMG